uniref:Candidate secreted effector n=1 Tax=Meloidogyne incognita TaxID=6306 RepID=A0A914LD71_MELIC
MIIPVQIFILFLLTINTILILNRLNVVVDIQEVAIVLCLLIVLELLQEEALH